MRVKENEKIIAILGTITGHVPMDALCEFHRPQAILLWGFDGISKEVYDWAKDKGIRVEQFYPSPYSELTINGKIKQIVELADAIFIFHDYQPSSWTDNYNSSSTDTPIDIIANKARAYAVYLGKRVKVTKLEKIYHHSFMIKDDDESDGHIFDVEIGSKDMTVESAKAEAMAKSQLYFIQYVNEPIRKRNKEFYTLKRMEGNYWRDVDTTDIEDWFSKTVKRYS